LFERKPKEKADPSPSLRFGGDDIFQLANFDSEL
jgi:hypothetical protein